MKKIMLIALTTLYPFTGMFAQITPNISNENPQQALSRAELLYAEGKTFKALHIYKQHKDILSSDQNVKLAIIIVESEDFKNTWAFDILKTAHDAGNTKVAPYLAKLYLEKKSYQDSSTGIQLLQKAMSQGDAAGYFYTGWEYVKNNKYREGREFYLKAANLGNSQAMNALGLLNQNGRGGPKNMLEALKWYSKSTAIGNAFAPMNLGKYYFSEPHINVDSVLKWFNVAIENGHPKGYFTMGLIYGAGNGFPIDIDKAREYLNLGIIHGDTACERYLAESYSPFLNVKTKVDSLIAFDVLRRAAAKGYDIAQCQLGRLILSGALPNENENTGKYWLERSAAQDNTFALYELGMYYIYRKDSLESKYYFMKAAELGQPQALISIFRDYPEEAHRLAHTKTAFDNLAKKNDLDIHEKYTLMQFYELGIGTEKNLAKTASLAIELYGKTPVQARYILRLLYEQKKFKEAVHWLNLALKEENSVDMSVEIFYYGGIIYAIGNEDVPVNYELSFKYFKMASDLGNLECMTRIAHAYLFGNGIGKNVDTAIAILEKAAAGNSATAQEMLGSIYMFGQFAEKNGEKSKYWLEKAAAQGEPIALNNLGECYYIGFGTDKDFEKAAFYYQQAVDKNLPMGKLSLGVLYLNGEGVKKDKLKAKALFESACKDGLEDGCTELKKL